MKSFLGGVARGSAAVALVVIFVDGLLSVLMGARWLEIQRDNTPRWYARFPAAVLALPEPAVRGLGGAQAGLSVLFLMLLR